MQCNCKFNSLVTSIPSHQVSIFTHTYSVHFSAFSLHNPLCVTSHQHTPHHGYEHSGGSVALAAIYCPLVGILSRQNRPKRWERWNIVGPYIPHGLFQTKGRRVQSLVPIGSEMWICISYKQTYIHTNKHSSLYIRYTFVQQTEHAGSRSQGTSWLPFGWIPLRTYSCIFLSFGMATQIRPCYVKSGHGTWNHANVPHIRPWTWALWSLPTNTPFAAIRTFNATMCNRGSVFKRTTHNDIIAPVSSA